MFPRQQKNLRRAEMPWRTDCRLLPGGQRGSFASISGQDPYIFPATGLASKSETLQDVFHGHHSKRGLRGTAGRGAYIIAIMSDEP